ncbi:MAG: thiol:disulfide interchange protein DsbA/DsbL [Gammaproteobacteria bacterium]|nr:MAG: thiol:disulfide interchange protein DsbA/DsbL [Gammaproteobacteria bacterium]
MVRGGKQVKRLTTMLLLGIVLGLAMAPVVAREFEEGINYEKIEPQPPIGKPGDKIEVLEFFMWLCPHCNRLEPHMQAWLKHKADDIEFVRVPAMFGGPANLHVKVFYALQAMGELDRLHQAFFDEIHKKRNRLRDQDAVEEFLQAQGVDIDKFRQAMNSFAVAAHANRAAALMRRYGIHGVPALVVDGRYKSGKGLDYKDMPVLVDYLADRVRRERRKNSE